MPIFSVRFHYRCPISNSAIGEESNDGLDMAENLAIAALDSSKLKHKHQYSWSDGSLYKWVESDLNEEELRATILSGITGRSIVFDVSVTEDYPNLDPYKVGYKTLRAYMDGIYDE